MLKIGITGKNGFIGNHLYNTLGLIKDQYELVPFEKHFFNDLNILENFVSQCDVIVFLSAVNRHPDEQAIFDINILLANRLIEALNKTKSKAHIIMSSSTQEDRDNAYGNSKKESRLKFIEWANKSGGSFVGMIIPNVFGPFGLPNYNSFIATFCYKLVHGEDPQINVDNEVPLIYVGDLVNSIIAQIKKRSNNEKLVVAATSNFKVSEILKKLVMFRRVYYENGEIPSLDDKFDLQLFNTFRSYIKLTEYFPKKFIQHTDVRGSFVEIIRLGIGGQISFSTTTPGITRGNHFHTRKIERFAVIKGKALIQLRKIGTTEVLNFYLDGNEPAYVDMPIWYTHNIKNIGEEVLYTNFWINECYNASDSDTFIEEM